MKKTIKLTEAKLRRIISEAIGNVMPFDFEDADRYDGEDEFRRNYNFGDDEDEDYEFGYDPTADDPEAYMTSKYYDGGETDLSDGDLYRF